MAENLITADELAAYAPDLDTSAFSAATISGMISRASERVRQYCQVDGFFRAAVTNERDDVNINSEGELIISFRRRPVAQGDVSAVRLRTVDVNQSLQLTSSTGDGSYIYSIGNPGNLLVYPSNFLISHGKGLFDLRGSNLYYEVDYTGGWATDIANIPPSLKEAATLMLRDLISARDNPAGVKSFSQGSYSVVYDKDGGSYVGEAQKILDVGGYVRRVP